MRAAQIRKTLAEVRGLSPLDETISWASGGGAAAASLLLPLPSSPLRGAPRTSNASFGNGERMGGRMRARDEAHLCNACRLLYRRQHAHAI